MTTHSNEHVKVKVPLEWIYRGILIALVGLIALGSKAKIKEIVAEEITPVVAKQDKVNDKIFQKLESLEEKMSKMTIQAEVMNGKLELIANRDLKKGGVMNLPYMTATNIVVQGNP